MKKTDVDKLKEEELVNLSEEVNLEELLVLGEDKLIPIEITFPKADGNTVKAKALIKQLTLKELDNIKLNNASVFESNILILEHALFKQNKSNFTREELLVIPLGVVNAISNKILEVSGVDIDPQRLRDF